MTPFALAALFVASLAAIYALFMTFGALRIVRGVPMLRDVPLATRDAWPSLSIVIPACNEADAMQPANDARAALTYPSLEFVYVDDRSTDDTGAMLDRLAAGDSRARVIHIDALPVGWIGKVHALSRGVAASTSEWVLFTDADVVLAPDAVTRAMSFALERGLDHVAAFPTVDSRGLVLDAAIDAFARVGLVGGRPWEASDPQSPVAMGVGAFNLVRRDWIDRIGGLASMQLEVSDDVGLAQLLKRAGARTEAMLGTDTMHLMFYPTLTAMARGAEKAAIVARFNAVAVGATVAVLAGLELSPFVLAAMPLWPVTRAIALVAALMLTAANTTIARRVGHSIFPALLVPLGSMAMLYTMARGGIAASLRGALVWRGTRYEAADLLGAQRTRFDFVRRRTAA